MTRSRKYIASAVAVVTIYMIVVGWHSVNYDSRDRAIGTEFYFTAPMVYLTGISRGFASRHVINKYGSVIRLERTWGMGLAWPQVVAEKVPCDERFVVKGAFKVTPWGLLKGAMGSDIKYYAIKSQDRPLTVIMDTYYAEFTKNAEYYNGLSVCPDPFSR